MEDRGIRRKRGRPRKKPKIEIEEEEMMSYKELQAKIKMLEEHNQKLTQLLSQSPVPCRTLETEKTAKKKTRKNIACYPKRQVLLKIVYLGWDYQSCASQEDIQKTIEDKLLQALLKITLIDALDTSQFHRCGKDDHGFNPFNQTVSIVLRSRLNSGLGVIPFEKNGMTIKEEPIDEGQDDDDSIQEEIKYTELVNKVLPPEIRVVAWCPVQPGYPERFDSPLCTYKYFFPRGNLNIHMMEEAAQHLIGRHNYISLYKRDASKGINCLFRVIYSVDICPTCCDLRATDDSKPLCDPVEYIRIHTQTESENEMESESDTDTKENFSQDDGKLVGTRQHSARDKPSSAATKRHGCKRALSNDGYDVCVITIKGQDFLWDEIRKIVAALFSIGEGKGRPGSILELLDVKNSLRTPQQSIASEMPLQLYQTTFEGEKWQWDKKALRLIVSRLQAFWCQQSVRAAAMRHTLWDLENCYLENTSDIMQEDVTTFDLPQDQCENLIGREKAHIFLSHTQAANTDHVYSTQKPKLTVAGSKTEDEDFNHTATLLLIELIRQRFQRFLLIRTRPAVYKELQEEMCFRGFSFSLEKIRKKWNGLITTYQKIKERKRNSNDLSDKLSWDYYQLLDDLLGTTVLAVPPSESVETPAPKPHVDMSHLQPNKSLTVAKPPTIKKCTADMLSSRVMQPAVTLPTPQAVCQFAAPVTTLLHHDGDTVFATQTTAPAAGVDEKPMRGASDVATVFLEYNLQLGEKRLDKMEQHILYMAEKAARKLEYKKRKEEREQLNLKALTAIGRASEELKSGLLSI
ncbi:uncharacterized protein [Procambarus clarkii]|uniref:uncharacterized protein n=1 Tax=Procambarus clarkii TaxID=6728 RepID=UPI0037443FD2